jgi:phosphatidylserine/phosphatidylglycerophosphate/cardiolipin synthase-like enzyme
VWLASFFHYAYTTTVTAYFSPDDKPTKRILELITQARRSICVAVYFFTDRIIAESLADARKRKLKVTVIVDQATIDSKYGQAEFLEQHGVDVYVFNADTRKPDQTKWSNKPLMHNKFALFDHEEMVTGSLNWTLSANDRNCENIVEIKDRVLCERYQKYFDDLLTLCIPYNSAEWCKFQERNRVSDAVLLERLVTLAH